MVGNGAVTHFHARHIACQQDVEVVAGRRVGFRSQHVQVEGDDVDKRVLSVDHRTHGAWLIGADGAVVLLMQRVPNQLASGFLAKAEGKEFHVSHFVHECLGEGIGIVDRGVEGANSPDR